MAVFLVNTCKFKGCGITFPTLTELIRHIEATHLDFDPQAIEQQEVQQPTCLPISYVLRVFSNGEYHTSLHRKESMPINQLKSKLGRCLSPAPSVTSTTPTGSEMEEDIYESESEESSIDSWSNRSTEGDSSHAIIKMLSTNNSNDDSDRPYMCTVNGCKKRYRNANDLYNFTPDNFSSTTKVYKCHCGKIYKTQHGLNNHCKNQHAGTVQATHATTIIRSNTTNVKTGKDSVLATFVRMKSMPSTAINTSSAQTVQGLPLIITAQSDVTIKREPVEGMKNESSFVSREKDLVAMVTNSNCPVIKAPTLQQHLLSPIIVKAASKC
ncbi:juxtaposed with another zinc finger protein 1-like protein [Leptotrombidium deliense]|uniref:Juxtaposed with another zinc finger protein 1-like protein n=1 Tax=Leptotrombidium deliense TaxID=299467 RepID=A0A443SGN9_9ACAR|nr:juxtaposed with another zinc finger protein 1-like protein [Leptotrombidium deliense]